METIEDVLAHYGIKGMKWGVRRSGIARGSVKDTETGELTPGLRNRKTGNFTTESKDSITVRQKKAHAKEFGTSSLSNKEIQDIVTRMNLERQYSQLNPKSNPAKKGQMFVKEGLAVFGTASALYAAANSPLAGVIKESLAKK